MAVAGDEEVKDERRDNNMGEVGREKRDLFYVLIHIFSDVISRAPDDLYAIMNICHVLLVL